MSRKQQAEFLNHISLQVPDNNFRLSARIDERCAGEGELIRGLTKRAQIVAERRGHINGEVLRASGIHHCVTQWSFVVTNAASL